jgi:hypothetical protein
MLETAEKRLGARRTLSFLQKCKTTNILEFYSQVQDYSEHSLMTTKDDLMSLIGPVML